MPSLKEYRKKYNISIEEFEGFLVQKVKLSHLHITPAGKIILTDFGNKEVRMDDLSKALREESRRFLSTGTMSSGSIEFITLSNHERIKRSF